MNNEHFGRGSHCQRSNAKRYQRGGLLVAFLTIGITSMPGHGQNAVDSSPTPELESAAGEGTTIVKSDDHSGHDHDTHTHSVFILQPDPLRMNLLEGWGDEWVHSEYSRSGSPYVHAFGIEPAFLCRDLLVSGAFVNGLDGWEYEVEAELELPLTRRLGLVVEGGYAWFSPDDAASDRGFGDIAVSPRFLMLEYDEFLLSLQTEFEFPTGDADRGFGSGEVMFAPSVSTWLDLGSSLTLQNSVGFEQGLGSDGEGVFFWGASLIKSFYLKGDPQLLGPHGGVCSHFPAGMLSLIAELGGELPVTGEEEGQGAGEWLLGASYMVTPQLALRGSVSFPAWNPREFNSKFTVGLIWHF
ncbi:MAG: hypothetical protein QGI75_02425 [Phycisphaerales bacterium]|nr:hypothetical protein [Phycisphaerales bacterium]